MQCILFSLIALFLIVLLPERKKKTSTFDFVFLFRSVFFFQGSLITFPLNASLWVKFSADDILKCVFLFFQRTGFDIHVNRLHW